MADAKIEQTQKISHGNSNRLCFVIERKRRFSNYTMVKIKMKINLYDYEVHFITSLNQTDNLHPSNLRIPLVLLMMNVI